MVALRPGAAVWWVVEKSHGVSQDGAGAGRAGGLSAAARAAASAAAFSAAARANKVLKGTSSSSERMGGRRAGDLSAAARFNLRLGGPASSEPASPRR